MLFYNTTNHQSHVTMIVVYVLLRYDSMKRIPYKHDTLMSKVAYDCLFERDWNASRTLLR